MPGWKRILCPVDFSETSRAALEEALEMARKCDGTVHLLHVLERPAGGRRGEGVGAVDPLEDLGREAQGWLARWRNEAERRLLGRVTTALAAEAAGGDTAAEVARVAREGDFDLVVMGTHGRRGIRRLVLGSVAELVVRSAPCPVLVIRPKGVAAEGTGA